MDVSNPVMSSDRITIEEMNAHDKFLKRQDMKFVENLVSEGKRAPAPEISGGNPLEIPDKALVQQVVDFGIKPVRKGGIEVKGKIEEKIPLSDYPKKHFKPVRRQKEMVKFLLARDPKFQEQIKKVIFCSGTKQGFEVRLNSWYDHKVVDEKKLLKDEGFNAQDILRRRMPVGDLPNWNGKILDLIKTIHITKNSSAGPPYFKPKMDVWHKIFEDLGKILEAAERNELSTYVNQNPALLTMECKNKVDRYKTDEVENKTRPYFSANSPIQFLISFLCQNFSENLKLFYQHKSSWNGYGFSMANGGGKKIQEWMKTTKEGETKLAVYGDDVKMVWRKDGILWEVNPDFSQQDASIDPHTVEQTIKYIIDTFKKQHGQNMFWESIGDIWYQLAINSKYWIEGDQLYHKKDASLRTGVVGTTVFDTAKSILAYELFVHQRIARDEESASKFFKKHGLNIKAGTWEPSIIDEDPEEGEFLTTHKWLGAKFRMVMGKNEIEPIPYSDEEDLAALVGNPRIDLSGMSRAATQRYLFDMARGYMITGSFWHPNIWNALCDVINSVDAHVIVMRVQANNGRGEKPELVHMVGDEEFQWPSSDGYPNDIFCKNVYLSEGNKSEGAKWIPAFADLESELKEYRKVREIVKVANLKEATTWSNEVNITEAQEFIDEVIDPAIPAVMQELVPLVSKLKISSKATYIRPLSVEQRKAKIKSMFDTDTYNSFNLDWALMVFNEYGNSFVFSTLLQNGWHPANGRMMTREKPEDKLSEKEYADLKYLMKDYNFSKNKTKPEKIMALSHNGPPLLEQAAPYLGGTEMDTVSKVSSAFVTIGAPLKSANVVISQAPPRVEHRVYSNQGFEAKAEAPSGKEARKLLFEDLLQKMMNINTHNKIKSNSEDEQQQQCNEDPEKADIEPSEEIQPDEGEQNNI